MTKILSMSAYARRRGVSEAAVRKAVKSGRISLTQEGKVDPEKADEAWQAQTRLVLQEEDLPSTYAELRKKYLELKVQREKWDFEQLKNQSIPKKAASSWAYQMGNLLRDRVDALPGRLSDVLASTQDPEAVEKILTHEMEAVRHVFEKPPPE